MKPATINFTLLKNTPYELHFDVVDAGGERIDLTHATIKSAISDNNQVINLSAQGMVNGVLKIAVPAHDHECMMRWELWMRAGTMDGCNLIVAGIMTVQDRVAPNDECNPASGQYQLRLSDRVTIIISPVDLAYGAQLKAQEALSEVLTLTQTNESTAAQVNTLVQSANTILDSVIEQRITVDLQSQSVSDNLDLVVIKTAEASQHATSSFTSAGEALDFRNQTQTLAVRAETAEEKTRRLKEEVVALKAVLDQLEVRVTDFTQEAVSAATDAGGYAQIATDAKTVAETARDAAKIYGESAGIDADGNLTVTGDFRSTGLFAKTDKQNEHIVGHKQTGGVPNKGKKALKIYNTYTESSTGGVNLQGLITLENGSVSECEIYSESPFYCGKSLTVAGTTTLFGRLNIEGITTTKQVLNALGGINSLPTTIDYNSALSSRFIQPWLNSAFDLKAPIESCSFPEGFVRNGDYAKYFFRWKTPEELPFIDVTYDHGYILESYFGWYDFLEFGCLYIPFAITLQAFNKFIFSSHPLTNGAIQNINDYEVANNFPTDPHCWYFHVTQDLPQSVQSPEEYGNFNVKAIFGHYKVEKAIKFSIASAHFRNCLGFFMVQDTWRPVGENRTCSLFMLYRTNGGVRSFKLLESIRLPGLQSGLGNGAKFTTRWRHGSSATVGSNACIEPIRVLSNDWIKEYLDLICINR